MKNALLLVIVALAAIFSSPAAKADTTASVSAEYDYRIQFVDLVYTAGIVTSAPVDFLYRSDVTIGGAVVSQPASTPDRCSENLIANADQTVTVDGVTYTYGLAFKILQAIGAKTRAAQLAAGH